MEVLLAVAIFIIAIVSLGVLFIDASVTNRRGLEGAKARQLAIEGLEAARAIRDASFASITSGTKGLAIVGNQWTFSGTSDTQDGFTRSLAISAPDTDTRYVTSTVSWEFTPGQRATTTAFTILTNWHKFVAAGGTWSNPQVAATTTITGGIPALAVDVQSNRLYLTTPASATGSEFWIYDISNETAPVVLGQLELGYDGNMLWVEGTRAHVATNAKPAEVKIIDVSSSTNPFIAGSIKLTSNQTINSVAANGNTVHFVREKAGNQFTYFIYNTTIPATPVLLGGLNLGDGARDLAITTSTPPFTYIAGYAATQEFQTINTTNPLVLGVSGSTDFPGTENFSAIAVSGTQAYLGSAVRAASQEFFVSNIAVPTSPSTLGSYEIGANVNRIRLHSQRDNFNSLEANLVFVATASSTNQLIIFDVSNPVAPAVFGKIKLPGTATGLALSTSTVYVTTDSVNAGLIILQAGP